MFKRSFSSIALALALGLSLPVASFAQTAATDTKKDAPAQQQPAPADTKKEEPKKEEPKKDPKTSDYEKAVKDLKRVDGPFAIYLRKKEILLELPEDKLGKVFLVQAALSTALDGFLLHAGMPVGGDSIDAFRFDKNEDRVWLVRPRISTRWDKNDPFAIGAERTFQEATLGSYAIEQTNVEKNLLLVNVTDLFYGDVFRLSEMISTMLGGAYMLDRSKSGVERANGYPENTIVSMKLQYASQRGAAGGGGLLAALGMSAPNTLEDDRSAPVRVVYNVWFRKEEGYQPRLADPRIGYFTNDSFAFSKYKQTDATQRFINRYSLEKKDPKAALSDPVKPIVWIVDPSIPVEYRDSIRKGILYWNKAFEAIGIKNAVQVQDPPKDDPNYDHADGRYNVVRMSPTQESPFAAIALARSDPFTGQVYNASVTIDGNVVRDLMSMHQNLAPVSAKSRQLAMDVLTRNDERKMQDDQYLFEKDRTEAKMAMEGAFAKFGWQRYECTYSSDLAKEVSLDWYAIQEASPTIKISREEFVKKYLEDCVAHEVGHTLGLRHNFAGSTVLTTAQLADDKFTAAYGPSASVMDYTPPNALAVLKGNGAFFNTAVGPYDMWAIKYGYSDFHKTTVGERPDLAAIARLSGETGHAFQTDEDADRWDPYAVRFDLGKDPVNYAAKALEAYRRARENAIKNLPHPGEPYSKRTEVIMSSILRSFREGRNAARFVGGVAASRSFRGDVGEHPTLQPVDPESQRAAMTLIVHNFLQADSFELPQKVLNTMNLSDTGGDWNAPLRDYIGANQANLAALMMSASTTDRIAENAYKNRGARAYNLDEHYGSLLSAIFSEVGTGSNITPLRRDLQKFVLNGLMLQASAPIGAVNEDVRTVASDSLRRLETRFDRAAKDSPKADGMTRIHLRDAEDQIRRFQARQTITR